MTNIATIVAATAITTVVSTQSSRTPETRIDLKVGFTLIDVQRLLVSALDIGCSDVKIQSGDYITVYYKRQWYPYTTRTLENTEVGKVLQFLAGPSSVANIGNGNEVDTDPEFFRENEHRVRVRFRLNAISCRVGNYPDGISITMRAIPASLPDMSSMKLPEGLAEDLLPARGVVLVSGQTGSGKTTLIAALLNERLKESPGPSILTYEQPPEFDYGCVGLDRGPLVSQVNIGQHLKSWSRAGPTAMRRKADLILMGEIRDPETAEATIEMGITGHGVYATIHADTPQETIFRLVEMFPEGARSAAASKLLGSLRAICSQKLVLTLSKKIVPLRSWIVFDSEIKDELSAPECPYPRWAGYVRDYVRKNKQDFASQCIPLIQQGEINVAMFRDITQTGKIEAIRLFRELLEMKEAV